MAKIKKVCSVCVKEYDVYPSKAEKSKTCSRQCAQIYAANSPAKRTGEKRLCGYCSKEYYINKYKANRGGIFESKFCSKECKDKYHSEHHIGVLSNLYVNGNYQGRGANWYIQRKKARERDNNTCKICGYKPSVNADVHHIKYYDNFSNFIEANDLSNLICLCHSCHTIIHNKARLLGTTNTERLISQLRDNLDPSLQRKLAGRCND